MKFVKKDLMGLVPQIAAFIILGIFAGVGAKILSDFRTGLTSGTVADDAVLNATQGIGNMTNYFGTLGTIVVLGAIIAVLFGVFAYFKFR